MQNALDGRRLCENTVGLLEEVGLGSWQDAAAVDRTEWVGQIRTVTTLVPPYQLQEASHASYWGQLAMRNCLRQAYNNGAVQGGRCVREANGLDAFRERQTAAARAMTLPPLASATEVAATADAPPASVSPFSPQGGGAL